jgi:AraC-like DNA-binding protein
VNVYQLRRPDPALSAYVEHYWFVSPDDGPVDVRVDVYVDGRADLVFNHGVPYRRQVLGGEEREIAASNLDAQRTVPIRITQRGRVRVCGVRFFLGGLGAFVPDSVKPWTNQTAEPAAVWGPSATALDTSLARLGPDEAALRLDAWLLARLQREEGRERVERALGLLNRDPGMSVADMARTLHVSRRQVERLLAHHVGIGPKTMGRILRFQRALRALMSDPGTSLAAVAADAGYFDQPHFIRDFRRMTGGVPRGYKGYFPEDGPHDFAPNVVAFVQAKEGARVAR